MSERRSKGILLAAIVWCVIIGVLAVAYKLLVAPYFAGRLEGETGSQSQYQHVITLAADSFSGYCILRSDSVRDQLKAKGIRLDVRDDAANYAERIRALRDGGTQMAVFTIDSYLSAGTQFHEFPGSIVLVLDETKGADALVAYKEGVANIQDLDHANARIVATPSSPSEFLARVVLASFSLPQLPEQWLVAADGAGDAYQKLRAAPKEEKRAYALWQPYVSMALKDSSVHVLLDSSKTSGLIVDVLVVQRKFLAEQPGIVRDVVEAYLRAAYSYEQQKGGLADLVLADARQTGGEKLSAEQAQELVDGIQWKNTMENYAHLGLLPAEQRQGAQHLEDMIGNIATVLVETGALSNNPIQGKESVLFFDGVLRELQASGFHPAKKTSALSGVGLDTGDLESVRGNQALPALTDAQWGRLVPVGEMRIRPIAFGRGGARINVQSERDLKDLANRLNSLPQYYLVIEGHARAEGDTEANLKLARDRAQAAANVLSANGIPAQRVKTKAAPPTAGNGSAQSVSFVVGQVPY